MTSKASKRQYKIRHNKNREIWKKERKGKIQAECRHQIVFFPHQLGFCVNRTISTNKFIQKEANKKNWETWARREKHIWYETLKTNQRKGASERNIQEKVGQWEQDERDVKKGVIPNT